MNHYPRLHEALVGVEFVCAFIACLYVSRLKNSHWKWFVVYLVFIFLQEFIWTFDLFTLGKESIFKYYYYIYVGIPLQYLFFYWLFAYKSLDKKLLFLVFSCIYLLSFIPDIFYLEEIRLSFPINSTIGTILLSFLVVLEFIKQIKTDNILRFKENKMFYINTGIIIFYIGTYPFFAFSDLLIQDKYIHIANGYYVYFLVSNYIMYILFAVSFIWGKDRLK